MDRKEYRRAYYLAHREKLIAQTRAHQLAHVEERKEYMRKYAEEHKESIVPYKKEKARIAWLTLKEPIFERLGKVCIQCGYSNQGALQIDHINGGGSEHRRQITGPSKYYQEILADPLIEEHYQILCANCNQLKKTLNNEYRRKRK